MASKLGTWKEEEKAMARRVKILMPSLDSDSEDEDEHPFTPKLDKKFEEHAGRLVSEADGTVSDVAGGVRDGNNIKLDSRPPRKSQVGRISRKSHASGSRQSKSSIWSEPDNHDNHARLPSTIVDDASEPSMEIQANRMVRKFKSRNRKMSIVLRSLSKQDSTEEALALAVQSGKDPKQVHLAKIPQIESDFFRQLRTKAYSFLQTPPERRQRQTAVEVMPVFKRLRFFQQLPMHVVHYILKECELVRCEAGTRLVKQGNKADSFFVILKGEVGIYAKEKSQPSSATTAPNHGTLQRSSTFMRGKGQQSAPREVTAQQAKARESWQVLAQKRRDARDEMKNLVNAAKTTSDYCEEEEQTEEERAERGRAALYGKKRVHLGQGLSFGEMAFVKSHRRTASVVTIMDSVLIKVSILGYSQTKTFTTDRVFEVSDKVKDVLRIHPGRRNPSQISTLVHQVGMHPFFNGMSTSAISHICKNIHMHAVLAGHLIFEQGQFGSRFYIIVTGSVSFHQHQQSQDDSDLIVARNSSYVDQHKENIKELEDKADQAVGQDIKDIKDIEMSWLSPDIMEGFMLEPDVHLEVQYGSCVAVFYAGAGFGEKALTANEKRRATCIAREDTQLLVVDRTTIKSIAQLQFEENQYSRPTDVPLMLSVPPQKRQLTDLQAISDYIAALDFFKNLPPDTRINVLRQCEYSVASENQVVFFQGETADLFYIILTGTVGVHVVDARKLKPGKSVRSLLGPVRADSATTTTIVENAEQASSKFGPCIRLLYSGTHFGDAVLGVRRASAGNIHDVNSSAPPAMPKRGATIVAKERTELLTLTQLEFRVLIQQARSGMSVKTDLLIQLPHMRYLNWDVLIKISNLLQLAVLLEGAPLVTLGQEGGFLHLVRSGDCSVFMNESLINSDEISQYEAPVRERVRARGGPMHIKNSNKAQKTNIRKLLDDMEISNQKDVLVADVKVGTLSVGELYGDFELFTGTGLKPYQATVVSHKMTQVYTISNAAFVELVPSFVLEKLEESARAKHLAFKQAGLKLLNQHKNGKVADQVPLKNNDSSGVQSGGDNTPRTSHEPDALPQKPPHIPERTFLPALQNLPGIRSSAPVMGSISEIGRSNAATSNKAGDVCRLPTLLQSQTLPGRVVSGRTPRVVSGRPRVVSGRSRVASGRSVRIASGRTMHPEKVGRSRIESGRRSDTVSNIVDHRVQMIDDIMQYDPNLTISVLPAILDSTHVPCGARGLQNAVSSSRPRILDVDVCSHWGPEPLSPHEQRRWKQNTIIGR